VQADRGRDRPVRPGLCSWGVDPVAHENRVRWVVKAGVPGRRPWGR
jgi:hypothetical protein